MILGQPCAFVDLETTGASAQSECITEVGLRLFHPDGDSLDFQQLLNPGKSIPVFISQLTGISNAMVAEQPYFNECAAQLFELLDGAVLIAHNARFDYSFLKTAFAQAGYSFKPKIVCTVKLSKALYPQFSRHNLDTICERIGYTRTVSHRAIADVNAMIAFIEYAITDQGLDAVNTAARAQFHRPSQPVHVSNETINAMPNVPGVYRFYGEGNALLYIGKSVRLRERVMSHFSADLTSSKEMRLSQEVRDIDWTSTIGELGALLLENHEIKVHSPIYNRRQRRYKRLWCFQLVENSQGALLPNLVSRPSEASGNENGLPSFAANIYGLYPSKAAANKWLMAVVDDFRLCKKMLGLETGAGRCFNYQLKKCAGVCAAEETVVQHNMRVRAAFIASKIQSWPFDGPAVIVESAEDWRDSEIVNQAMHIIHNWVYLGTVNDAGDIEALLHKPTQASFDKESYRLINKYIHLAVSVESVVGTAFI